MSNINNSNNPIPLDPNAFMEQIAEGNEELAHLTGKDSKKSVEEAKLSKTEKKDANAKSALEGDTLQTADGKVRIKRSSLKEPNFNTESLGRSEDIIASGKANPWLKPNGLVALQVSLIELAMAQTQIKVDSAEYWTQSLKSMAALAKEIAQTVLDSAKLEAKRYKAEAEFNRAQAGVHIVSAIVAGAQLAVIGGSALKGRSTFKKNRAKLQEQHRTRMDRKKQMNDKIKTNNNKIKRLKNEKAQAELEESNLRKNNTEETDESFINARHEVTTKDDEIKKLESENAQLKKEFYESQENTNYMKGINSLKERRSQGTYQSTQIAQMGGQLGNSIAQAVLSFYEAGKNMTLADISLEKGYLDAQLELLRLLKDVASKGLEQAEKDRRDAAEIFSKALQDLEQIQRKVYQMGISLRGSA